MSAARYVPIRAIQAAVRGREIEVLDGLGILWREARPHLRCPYPEHADEDPSWRWEEKRAKARCTCTRGDSIFDVVMKVEALTFEAAKLRVAEILGRADLIREPIDGQRFQATDAASLLRPPAEQRDDALPLAYLAHRLDVTIEEVPRPATPLTGFKALAYFDPPPQGSRAKPKLVGHYPCVVFGTVAADGQCHAQRIYVATGGAGKADLGIGPNGRPRDPKKSAKVVGETSTAGCAALWGDPAGAPHLIVAEGIETGTAVALAFKAEIAAGEVAVAAAVSAAGIEAFRPWPATRRVTVAADRDEAPKPDGRPGSRRGERAARTFALAHRERIQVAIALPGAPGESIDWLDALNRDRVEAVRVGITTAEPFAPTRTELEEQSRGRDHAAALERAQRRYPLPAMDTVRLAYAYTDAGRIKVHKLIDKDPVTGQAQGVWLPVATPFGVTARLRRADQEDGYGIRVVVEDMAGEPRDIDFNRGDLARMGAAEVRAQLFEAGLRTEGEGEAIAVQVLKAADPAREVVVVSRPGWHRLFDRERAQFAGSALQRHGARPRRAGACRRPRGRADDLQPGQRHRKGPDDLRGGTQGALRLANLPAAERRMLARGEGAHGRRHLDRGRCRADCRRRCHRHRSRGRPGHARRDRRHPPAFRPCRPGLRARAHRPGPAPQAGHAARRVFRAATAIAGTGDSAKLRAALPFALLFVAGQLAVSIKLLPKDTPVADAVGWAWERFVHSSDAAVLAPDEQALNSLRTWIAERWDVTIKGVETGWEDGDVRRINNRESLAWYDDEVVYLPTRRAREASGGALKELHLARLLADRSMLARRDKDRFTVRYVPKIGHVQCYALRRCDFGRTAAPAFTVHEGGRR